jgi:hypothetical protein
VEIAHAADEQRDEHGGAQGDGVRRWGPTHVMREEIRYTSARLSEHKRLVHMSPERARFGLALERMRGLVQRHPRPVETVQSRRTVLGMWLGHSFVRHSTR